MTSALTVVISLFASLSLAFTAQGQADPRVVRVAEIRMLSAAEVAAGVPVSVRGVVTHATLYELFIQDETGAIFVERPGTEEPLQLGDEVEVSGRVSAGHFAPVISEAGVRVVGKRPLPVPPRVGYERLASGAEDCRWVEVAGLVRSDRKGEGTDSIRWLRVAMEGAILTVKIWVKADAPPPLFGRRIRLRGVASGLKNQQRQLVEPVIYVMAEAENVVLESEPLADPFASPLRMPGDLRLHGSDSAAALARVRGSVTCQVSPDCLFLNAGSQALEVRLQAAERYEVGDVIDVVGFPSAGRIQPLLQDAISRSVERGPAPIPLVTTPRQLLLEPKDAALVQVEAELRGSLQQGGQRVLVLADGHLMFNAMLADSSPVTQELPPIGSRVAVTGVCQIESVVTDEKMVVWPVSFRLLLRQPADVRIVRAPSWWTSGRLLALLGGFACLAFAALVWASMLRKRVRQQTHIILRKAQNEAVLEERNRIAREFHDSVEQELAGVTIQLDAVSRMLAVRPELARKSLDTARAMVRHSLDEAQRAVADLRSAELVEQDLPAALRQFLDECQRSRPIEIDFGLEGEWPELDGVTENHLLRIAQESVTNALKHGEPARISVRLRADADQVSLTVADDGRGFDPASPASLGSGQFGLLGMRERTNKIGAALSITSEPGRGVEISVTLRLDRIHATQPMDYA